MFVVVSYDIKEDRRRGRIFRTLKNFGQWVQFSVFECDIEKGDYLRMRDMLEKHINLQEGDSIRFYFLCEEDIQKIERIGGIQPLSEDAIIL
ncbi:CRISPR-associated endonuclease Cas2 [Methylacidiphilum caldifontis]|uniref:CRISPR-associated endoribonuclease Cas2 n=1 Tax=Methylacidiphilum caldifontis TaxID=2795386 RepID=A0A4Y8PAM8_9BACT|nr:CRISPR-associated endonuclease Cas2 [Methylacidiphilum caldifontis]TFE67810.1 CRISPR-associated endonuclease Cas2 [Methylacidiphilum caldifontis]